MGVALVNDKKKVGAPSSAEDSERTLVTLDQLSQTIEVMSSVVNRLRMHLSEQVAASIKYSELGTESKERKSLAVELPSDSEQLRDPRATLH
tara:strand:- start:243 stop:518 length:276 start_codon:yes stop_codon:yes gene_type:complete